MQKPNLIKVLILVLAVCICLFGCSAKETGTIMADTSANSNTISAVTSTNNEKNSSSATVKAENSSTKNNKDTTSNSKTTTAKQTTKQSTKTNKTTKPTAKQTTTRTTTSSTVNCTVTVECKNVLEYMDNLKAGHEAFVPSGGIFFSRYPVTLKNGSTVYDAVKIACGDNGVTINATNSQYGTYIAGFNNIDEKDCGNQSGWLYSVNGNMPGKSCGKYIVSNGDNIVFSYTCSNK